MGGFIIGTVLLLFTGFTIGIILISIVAAIALMVEREEWY